MDGLNKWEIEIERWREMYAALAVELAEAKARRGGMMATYLDLDDVAAENPLAQQELEVLREKASLYDYLKSIARVGITKRQEFVITLDFAVPCPDHIGLLDLALDADMKERE